MTLSSPLKMALLSDADTFAGTERHILHLADGLRSLGAEPIIVCPKPGLLAEKAEAALLRVIPLQKKGELDFVAVRTLKKMWETEQLDLLHVHNGRTALLSAMGLPASKRGRLVMTQHFITPAHVSRTGLKAFISQNTHHWMHRRISHTIAISEAVRNAILERGEAHPTQITMVPNGVPEPDAKSLTSPAEVRRTLGLSPDSPLVVCIARLAIEKDVASLISAMAKVREQFPDVVALVAGEGDQKEALEAQIASLNLQGTVRLLGFRTDVMSLVNAADLFTLPSPAEPFGLAVIEAMALSKPVVATRAGGPLEIVQEGETGLLVSPHSPDELAQALISLLRDPARMREMAEKGYCRYRLLYTVEVMTKKTLVAYQSLLCLEKDG